MTKSLPVITPEDVSLSTIDVTDTDDEKIRITVRYQCMKVWPARGRAMTIVEKGTSIHSAAMTAAIRDIYQRLDR